MPDLKRIERELKHCRNFEADGVKVEMIDDSLVALVGTFKGPESTVYSGGEFVVSITIPDGYPFSPPIYVLSDDSLTAETMVYHPNVSSQTGMICLDILKDAWSPVLTLKTAMISLQSLLHDPSPDDPQDAHVASIYIKDREQFNETARQWTLQHAVPGGSSLQVNKLCGMGFEEKAVRLALEKCAGDEAATIEYLLNL